MRINEIPKLIGLILLADTNAKSLGLHKRKESGLKNVFHLIGTAEGLGIPLYGDMLHVLPIVDDDVAVWTNFVACRSEVPRERLILDVLHLEDDDASLVIDRLATLLFVIQLWNDFPFDKLVQDVLKDVLLTCHKFLISCTDFVGILYDEELGFIFLSYRHELIGVDGEIQIPCHCVSMF